MLPAHAGNVLPAEVQESFLQHVYVGSCFVGYFASCIVVLALFPGPASFPSLAVYIHVCVSYL